jgi:hypothetical protein
MGQRSHVAVQMLQCVITVRLRLPPKVARFVIVRYRPDGFPQIALHALCDFGRNVLIKAF